MLFVFKKIFLQVTFQICCYLWGTRDPGAVSVDPSGHRRLQDVLKRSQRLTTKRDVNTTYGKRRRIYDVFVKINLLRENKPPAPTGIRKDNSWSICQLSVAVPANMLKQESLAQTNLVYNRPSLSRDLH